MFYFMKKGVDIHEVSIIFVMGYPDKLTRDNNKVLQNYALNFGYVDLVYQIAECSGSNKFWLLNESRKSDSYVNAAMQVINNKCARKRRLLKRVCDILDSGNCYFLTFTFSDFVFENTLGLTRQMFVKEYLRKYCNKYIANIDFGKLHQREHYHAIVQADYINCKDWFSIVGDKSNLDFKSIRKGSNPVYLANYVNKLCLHALKKTVKGHKIIYSRKRK